MKKDARSICQSPEFLALTAKKCTVSAILTVIMLGAYFGFILVLAFDQSLLSNMLTDGLSVGLPVGLGIILLAWLLTGVYVRWANNEYDSAVNEIRQGLRRD